MYKPTERDKIEDMRRERDREETLEIMGYTKEAETKSKSPFKESVERTIPVTIESPSEMPEETENGMIEE